MKTADMNVPLVSSLGYQFRGHTLMSSTMLVLRLLRREMRGKWWAFAIFLLCISLGISAIMSVDILVGAMQKSIQRDAKQILGADLELSRYYQPMNPDQVSWIVEQPNVKLTQLMEIRGMSYAPQTDKRHPVKVDFVDQYYPLFGGVELQRDVTIKSILYPPIPSDPPPILITKKLANNLGEDGLPLEIGSPIRFGDQNFVVGAIITKRIDVGFSPFQVGEPVLAAMSSLKPASVNQSLVEYKYRIQSQDVAEFIDAFRQRWGDDSDSWRMRQVDDVSQGVSRNIVLTSHFMTLVGLVSLLLGGLGIANSVRLFLASRAQAIAVMRVQGGSMSIVRAVYLLYILIVALIGIAIGMGLAVVISYAVKPMLPADLFGSLVISVPLSSLFTVMFYGLMIVLIFSVIPLSLACKQPITHLLRQQNGRNSPALSFDKPEWVSIAFTLLFIVLLGSVAVMLAPAPTVAAWFVIASLGVYGLFWMIGKGVCFVAQRITLPVGWPLANIVLRHIGHPGSITSMVMMSLGMGFTALVMIGQLQYNLVGNALAFDSSDRPSLYVVNIPLDERQTFENLMRNNPVINSYHRYPTTRARITHIKGEPVQEFKKNISEEQWVLENARVISWGSGDESIIVKQELVEGNWWPADYQGDPLISVDADIADAFSLALGDTMTWDVAGIPFTTTIVNTRTITWTGMDLNFAFILSPGLINNAPQSDIASLQVSSQQEQSVIDTVSKSLPSASVLSVQEILDQFGALMSKMVLAVQLMALFVLAVGIAVLSGVVVASHERRLLTAVIMKVLGARRTTISTLMLGEYITLGLICSVTAGVVGVVLAGALVTQILDLNWMVSSALVLEYLALALSVSVGFGALSLWFLLREKPLAHLRND